ncbi:MAG: hypothetical protein ABUK14_03765, partial [Desulfobacteria bacterium]
LNIHRPFASLTRGTEGAEKSIFSFVGRPQRNRLRIPRGRRRQTKTIRPAFGGSKTYYLSPKGQVAFVRSCLPAIASAWAL